MSSNATAPEAVPELLRRAADWYLAAGQVDQAVRLLTTAGDRQRAASVLLSAEDEFLEQGAAATYVHLGDQLGEAIVRADPRLAVSMAGAAAQSGQLERVPALLDLAEARLHDHSPPYPAWRSLAAAAAVLRAAYDPRTRADPPAMLAAAERAVSLETDPTLQGYVIARITLGAVLSGLGRSEDAVPVLAEAWERSGPPGCRSSSACRRPVCWACASSRPAARTRRGGSCIRWRRPCRGCWTLWGMRPLPPSPSWWPWTAGWRTATAAPRTPGACSPGRPSSRGSPGTPASGSTC